MLRRCAIAVTPYYARLFRVRFFLVCLLIATAVAQRAPTGPQPLPTNLDPLRRTATIYSTLPGTGVLVFTVYNERKGVHLDRQALLKLVSPSSQSPVWQTTLEDTSQGVFANLAYGNYNVEVSAVGYLSSQREVQVPNSLSPRRAAPRSRRNQSRCVRPGVVPESAETSQARDFRLAVWQFQRSAEATRRSPPAIAIKPRSELSSWVFVFSEKGLRPGRNLSGRGRESKPSQRSGTHPLRPNRAGTAGLSCCTIRAGAGRAGGR
jgi:hypothetical protein